MKVLTFIPLLAPILKDCLDARSNSTFGVSLRNIVALDAVRTHVWLRACRVSVAVTLLTASSGGVNESWMTLSRASEPVNTVFFTTAPSLDSAALRFLGLSWGLMGQSCAVSSWSPHIDKGAASKCIFVNMFTSTVVCSRIGLLQVLDFQIMVLVFSVHWEASFLLKIWLKKGISTLFIIRGDEFWFLPQRLFKPQDKVSTNFFKETL